MSDKEAADFHVERKLYRVLVNGKASHGDESTNVYLEKQAGGVMVRRELLQPTKKPTTKNGVSPSQSKKYSGCDGDWN